MFYAGCNDKEGKINKQQPDFSRPFVQGPRLGGFIYIDTRAMAGQHGVPQWRLKIPLSGIAWSAIESIKNDAALCLESRVPGTGKGGNPNCATVKPFEGWATAQ